jgi:hypothetical protein
MSSATERTAHSTQDPHNHDPTQEEWRELARQASEEEDLKKALDLARQVLEKYDEQKKHIQ